MSDGIAHIGPPRVIKRTIGGKEYQFTTIILADHAEKENYILGLRPDVMQSIATLPASAPKHVQELVVNAALKAVTIPAFCSRDQEQSFDESLHGMAWGIWRSLRDNHDEFGRWSDGKPVQHRVGKKQYAMTPAEGVQTALNFMEQIGNKQLEAVLGAVRGSEQQAELGNSSGPSQTNQSPTTTQAPTADSPGASSTAG